MQFFAATYIAAAAMIASAAVTPIARQNNPGDYGLYELVQADGSCLIPNITRNAAGGIKFENGTPVIAGDCATETNNAIYWLMKPQTPSSIQISAITGDLTSYCLDAGSNPGNGTPMKLWQCYDGLFQQTWFQTADNRTALYNGNQCLDLARGSTTFVQTWQCTTGDIQQQWVANGPFHVN